MADFTMCPSTWPIASTSVTCDSFDYDVINTHTQQQQAGTKNKSLVCTWFACLDLDIRIFDC